MKRDGERTDPLPSWEELSLSEKIDVVALPVLVPVLLWVMFYLTGSE